MFDVIQENTPEREFNLRGKKQSRKYVNFKVDFSKNIFQFPLH